MSAFTLCMVRGWKSDLGRMVEITTLEVGKVCVAFMATRVTESATRSCCARRSFVPTWMMMWLGSPRFSLFSCCRAISVFGHQSFNVLWPGKSCFSLMNLPFESIKMMTSVDHFLAFGALGGLCLWCCWSAGLRCWSVGCCCLGAGRAGPLLTDTAEALCLFSQA